MKNRKKLDNTNDLIFDFGFEEKNVDITSTEGPKSNAQESSNTSKFTYTPTLALAHSAPYKIHKYFARRPWNVFNQLVKQYSFENEIILDPFCGGGVSIYEGLKEGRKTVGFDLNPLSIFIIRNMIKKPERIKFLSSAFDNCISYLNYLYQDTQYFNYNGERIFLEWFELCFRIKCNYCKSTILLSNSNKIANGVYRCSNIECNSHQSKKKGVEPKDCERVGRQYLFKVGFDKYGNKITLQVDEKDISKLNANIKFLTQEIKKSGLEVGKDLIPINWDRQNEDLLQQKGIINFQDLFTERNLLINTLLLNYIKTFIPQLINDHYELLRMCFSNTLKDTNIMSFTDEKWQSGRPVNWSKHAYWIPSQFCEVNVIKAFQAAFNRVKASLTYNSKFNYTVKLGQEFTDLEKANILLKCGSIAESNIPDNSIDAIITDPPYGSNVQYLELSHFWFPWNKDLYGNYPEFNKEAVSNRKKNFQGSKSMYDYEKNLHSVFLKCFQVLKHDRHMVLTFNNKDISAWLALLISIFKAGFTLEKDGLYFQDGVKNYKQTSHTKYLGSPYGDFIYDFKKSKSQHPIKIYSSENDFIKELDLVFKKWICSEHLEKNTIVLNMILEAVPLIESFSKSYLQTHSHCIYSYFKKDYLNKLYRNE